MTTTEAGNRLGITPRSVVQLIRRGRIEAAKIGRDYWIEDSEIERYQAERKQDGRPRKEQGNGAH